MILRIYSTTTLFIITFLIFGALGLLGFVSNPDAKQVEEDSVSVAYLMTTPTLTPTVVLTYYTYLPVMEVPPNDLIITNLSYSGNDEFVQITNNGPSDQSMAGWRLISVVGSQTYNFPNGVVLAVGETLWVHSGPGAINNPPSDLFWSTAFLWNNQGDKAQLIDDQLVVRDEACYLNGC